MAPPLIASKFLNSDALMVRCDRSTACIPAPCIVCATSDESAMTTWSSIALEVERYRYCFCIYPTGKDPPAERVNLVPTMSNYDTNSALIFSTKTSVNSTPEKVASSIDLMKINGPPDTGTTGPHREDPTSFMVVSDNVIELRPVT